MAVDGKRFLKSNASSIPGTYFRLGLVTLRFLQSRKHSIRGTFYRQLPLIQSLKMHNSPNVSFAKGVIFKILDNDVYFSNIRNIESSAVDGKRFLKFNASSILGKLT